MQSVPREAVMECRSLDRTGRIENSTATVVEDGGGPMAGTGRPQTASSMSASYSQQQPQQFRRQQSGHRKGPQKQEEHREAGAEDRRGSHPPLPPEPRSQGPSQQPSVSTHGEGGTGPPYGISGEPVGGEFLPARAPSDETGGFPQHPDTPGPGPTLAAPSSPDLSLPPPLDVHPVDAYEEAGEGERRDVSRGATSPSPLAPGGGVSLGSGEDDGMWDLDELNESTQNVTSERDLGAAFGRAMQAHPLKERGLEFALRKTTVQEFFRDFISDKAVLGIDKYHGKGLWIWSREWPLPVMCLDDWLQREPQERVNVPSCVTPDAFSFFLGNRMAGRQGCGGVALARGQPGSGRHPGGSLCLEPGGRWGLARVGVGKSFCFRAP